MNYQRTNYEILPSGLTHARPVDDVADPWHPRSGFALCVASTCHPSSRLVFRGLFSTSRKNYSLIFFFFFVYSIDAASTIWGGKAGLFPPFGSVRVGLPLASVAVPRSSHMALICDSSRLQSARNPKARTTPRVPPVSQPECDSSSQDFPRYPTLDMHDQNAGPGLLSVCSSNGGGLKSVNKMPYSLDHIGWISKLYFQNFKHLLLCVGFNDYLFVLLRILFEWFRSSWAWNPFVGALIRYRDVEAY